MILDRRALIPWLVGLFVGTLLGGLAAVWMAPAFAQSTTAIRESTLPAQTIGTTSTRLLLPAAVTTSRVIRICVMNQSTGGDLACGTSDPITVATGMIPPRGTGDLCFGLLDPTTRFTDFVNCISSATTLTVSGNVTWAP